MIPANNHPEIDRLIHLKKHLGGMTMSKLISCQFNIDTACVELVFDDGPLGHLLGDELHILPQ